MFHRVALGIQRACMRKKRKGPKRGAKRREDRRERKKAPRGRRSSGIVIATWSARLRAYYLCMKVRRFRVCNQSALAFTDLFFRDGLFPESARSIGAREKRESRHFLGVVGSRSDERPEAIKLASLLRTISYGIIYA